MPMIVISLRVQLGSQIGVCAALGVCATFGVCVALGVYAIFRSGERRQAG